jgi:hypothetical protein
MSLSFQRHPSDFYIKGKCNTDHSVAGKRSSSALQHPHSAKSTTAYFDLCLIFRRLRFRRLIRFFFHCFTRTHLFKSQLWQDWTSCQYPRSGSRLNFQAMQHSTKPKETSTKLVLNPKLNHNEHIQRARNPKNKMRKGPQRALKVSIHRRSLEYNF